MMAAAPRDLAELVRLPAALTVPGDAWSGAACAGSSTSVRAALAPLGPVLLYWSGMALNDWADREVDAAERPERVLPSGRVDPDTALAVAVVGAAAGVAATAVVGGPRALLLSVPLAALVAAYDLVAKSTVAGPLVMASTRGLDVLLGAPLAPSRALAPAASVAVHTVGVTALSRGEVHGTPRSATVAALVSTTAAIAVLAVSGARAGLAPHQRALVLLLGTAYATTVAGAQARTLADPGAARVRAATGAGIGGLTFLQAGWLAARGRTSTALAVALAGPVLRRAARAVSPT